MYKAKKVLVCAGFLTGLYSQAYTEAASAVQAVPRSAHSNMADVRAGYGHIAGYYERAIAQAVKTRAEFASKKEAVCLFHDEQDAKLKREQEAANQEFQRLLQENAARKKSEEVRIDNSIQKVDADLVTFKTHKENAHKENQQLQALHARFIAAQKAYNQITAQEQQKTGVALTAEQAKNAAEQQKIMADVHAQEREIAKKIWGQCGYNALRCAFINFIA
ncbi:MAG TPA: hypothetical protein VLG71_01690 [Candidatus Limnocylindria bacterium]|nr:hypothetical protein [Candidatus Limnocylindria bacterium]